ncbi:MAG: DUF1003 domain-containing protein [Deltaproteobacteria bacterium]|nr:DUF1003 domain-containing protein [Deltaproteobacteria bacterium]
MNTAVMSATEGGHEETGPVCQVCGCHAGAELRPGVLVRPAVGELIRRDLGTWNEQGWICENDLQRYRCRYVETFIEAEKGELTGIEREVIDSIRKQDILATNPIEDADKKLTFGQRMADRIADFGGSWTFIFIFFAVLVGWMLINTYLFAVHPFDPYPYILLNLVLSCLAAIQAPIIMMSQNRQEDRDRSRALHDYQVNLKAELEIRHLHQKVDHLLSHQWEMLLEIQETQREFLHALEAEKRGES